MKVLILGGGGFLGRRLALEILNRGSLVLNGRKPRRISQLAVVDTAFPLGFRGDDRLIVAKRDISDKATMHRLLAHRPDVIFHLAAVVSGEAEKNFDLGMQVNLHATLHLLEACQDRDYRPVLVFASSCAVFGGKLAAGTIHDSSAATPQSSYGTQKAISDLLINDYSRRGYVDGRNLRLPTIAIRPGKPNAATTSFVSGIIREPLRGNRAVCPVSKETEVWILSPKRVIENFIHAAALEASQFGKNRVVNLPGITTTIAEMVGYLEKVGGKEAVARIDWTPDDFLQSIVLTFPTRFETTRADALGFKRDQSVGELIDHFVKEDLL
jgi:nucleoside-diphosphate-sugar epimerase